MGNDLEKKKSDVRIYILESMVIVHIRDDEVLDEDNNRHNGEEGVDLEVLEGRISGISGLIQCVW